MADEKRIGSELDLLMSLDPLLMSDQDIDKIIAYEREQRIAFELGVKVPKKDQAVTFDISKVVSALTPGVQQSSIARRKI